MKANMKCIYCIIKKVDKLFMQFNDNEDERIIFMKETFKIISEMEKEDTAPYIFSKVLDKLNEKYDVNKMYSKEKIDFNNRLLDLQDDIEMRIENSSDKVKEALKYSLVGNLIDLGALDEVDKDLLNNIINSATLQIIDEKVYSRFLRDLYEKKKLLFLCDNAGEIVFDKLLIKVLKEEYPNLEINVLVRGKSVLNDVTIEDAQYVGLTDIVKVIPNGNSIPGTQIDKLSLEAKDIFDNSGMIISKGQGNFETLSECGLNIYYMFLCKCDLFTKRFNVEQFTGIFTNEEYLK